MRRPRSLSANVTAPAAGGLDPLSPRPGLRRGRRRTPPRHAARSSSSGRTDSSMTPRSAAPDDQVRRYVETHHIDHIPAAARHGAKWQQLFFWAGANFNVFNLVLGGGGVVIGLTFW